MGDRELDVVSTTFIDEKNGEKFVIVTNRDDANKIKTDPMFATTMFVQAKKGHKAAGLITQSKKKHQSMVLTAKTKKACEVIQPTTSDREPSFEPSSLPEERHNDLQYLRDKSTPPIPELMDESGSDAVFVLPVDEHTHSADDDHDDTNLSGDVCHWTTSMCKLLLTSNKAAERNFTSGKLTKTQAWNIISEKMGLKNYEVSGLKCQSKFASLKRTYKSYKDHNKKSGNGKKKSWKYLDQMDAIFGNKPWINPVTTTSSSSASKNTESDTNEAAERSTRKRKSNTADYLKDLVAGKITARKFKEAQHAQKIEEVRKMNTLLEKILQQNQ